MYITHFQRFAGRSSGLLLTGVLFLLNLNENSDTMADIGDKNRIPTHLDRLNT